MTSKIEVDLTSSVFLSILEDFKKRTLDTMKFKLDKELDKESQSYEGSVKKYEYLKNLYDFAYRVNKDYSVLYYSFQEIVNQMKGMKLKESIEKGRLMPSQIEEFNEIWLLIEEIYNYYQNGTDSIK